MHTRHWWLWLVVLACAFVCQAKANSAAPLRVVTDNNFPPYVFVNQNGQLVGYEVDLWKLWEKKTGRKVDFIATDWGDAQSLILAGKADVIDLMYQTPERSETYLFSPPIGSEPVSIYAREQITGLDNIKALKGFTVGVERGDACIDHLHADGITNLKLYKNYNEVINAAANREIPAFCMDDKPAHYYLYLHEEHAHFKKAFFYYQGELHRAVLKGHADTLKLVNSGMKLITQQERDELNDKWMGTSIYFTPYTRIFMIGLIVMIAVSLVAAAALRGLQEVISRKTRELKDKNAQLTSLINGSPDLIWMKDAEGTYLACNQEAALYFGRPSDEIVGCKDIDIVHPEVAQHAREVDKKTIRSGQRTKEEMKVVNPNTSAIHVFETVKAPLVDAEGNATGIVAVGRDITDRKLAESRLQQAAMLFDSTSDCILVADMDCRIVIVNSAFTKITGYGVDEVRGKQPLFLVTQHGIHKDFTDLWSTSSHIHQWQGEVWCRRKDGEIFPTWWNVNPSCDSKGEVTHLVAMFTDTGKLKSYESQIEYLTYFDMLTKLPNRSLLMDRLEQAIRRAAQKNRKAAVMLVGLDQFKRINETMGHSAGDVLLQEVAQRIIATAPLGKTVARSGSDEFALVLRDTTDAVGMTGLAERLLEAIARPIEIDGEVIQPRASIGISMYPKDGQDAGSLVKNAISAMHHVKKSKYLKMHFYDAELSATAKILQELEGGLVNALKNSEFELFYQPKWRSGTDTITGVEALIRWNRPGSGKISPSQFLPLTEEMGISLPIGRWVLETACAQIAQWRLEGIPPVPIAVNITEAQLVSSDFVSEVCTALETHDLQPQCLELEITEGQLVQRDSVAEKALTALRKLGIRVAIDDFGTGYSSLSYLRHLPADALKIDKSFIDEIPDRQDAVRIVAAIISMAHTLDMKVVAEGVETKEQADLLHELNCDYLQGYYKSRPLPADELSKFWRSNL